MILDVREICSNVGTELSTFIHNIITIIKIGVPIVLVLFGMLDLGKGVIASKEDEIKKGQQTFIKRLIAGVIVFFIVAIMQLAISLIDRESSGEFWECANKIMNGKIGEPLTAEEKEAERYRIIEQCCIAAEGKVIKGTREDEINVRSCDLTDGQPEKYNTCYDKKMGK
jgi:hypothetical protein